MILLKPVHLAGLMLTSVMVCSCGGSSSADDTSASQTDPANTASSVAAITAVSVSGESGSYTFSVTIESPDTGCDQYADWWEVLTASGDLVYRRILTHSHVDEQPFTRSGSPINVAANEDVIVRAHMNNTGYSAQVISGSVEQGLSMETLDTTISEELAFVDPLPTGCAF